MISHTTRSSRKCSPNCQQRFNAKPVEHIESLHRIRINRVFVSSQCTLRGQFILFGSVPVIEQWESWKAMKLSGIGSARTLFMTNFFHNGGVDPWVEKEAEGSASHPKR